MDHGNNGATAVSPFRAQYLRLDERQVEMDAKDLFRKAYTQGNDTFIEQHWQKDEIRREACLEQARVKLDMQSFWIQNGSALLNHYTSLVKTFPDQLVQFEPDEARFLKDLKQCQLLLLTANQVENRTLIHLLYHAGGGKALRWRSLTGLDNCTWTLAQLGSIQTVHLAPLDSGSFSKNGSRNAVERARKYFDPMLVVSLGVAYGANVGQQRLGDVLVSSEILPSDIAKRTEGRLELRGEIYPTSDHIRARWEALLSSEQQPKEAYGFHWYFGPMLSGGSVISDAEEKLRLLQAAKNQGKKAVGGEMEGSGIYSICEKIPCIVIKGICDWAVLKNGWAEVSDTDNNEVKDCVQGFAAHHAFEALCYLLSKAPVGDMPIPRQPDWPPQVTVPHAFSLNLGDLKDLLADKSHPILNIGFSSDEAFLRALLPDYLCPVDVAAAMNGEVPNDIIHEFFRDRETSVQHILQKCGQLLRGVDTELLFCTMLGVLHSINSQDRAGSLYRACYLHCTAGRTHPERGLAVLTVFTLLGPQNFLNLLPRKEDCALFCQ